MRPFWQLVFTVSILQMSVAVKVKVVMHSEQEDSRIEDEEVPRTESWRHKKRSERQHITMLPFLKTSKKRVVEKNEFEEEKPTTEKPQHLHPNELIFPLIYRQNHINSMFKFGENWYTWSTEERTDGAKAINYYICYDEIKRCDEIGWERTENLPRCAFQIDSLMPDDRACINNFGVEPHTHGVCDGGEQMKVNEITRTCGPRIRSLWRFLRVSRRPANAPKPADVNSLICEDEEECYITIEYRIHHDRITFSLHEPTRGQTFKSALKREIQNEEEHKIVVVKESRPRIIIHRGKKKEEESRKKIHLRSRTKVTEGKGVVKERNDSGYTNHRLAKNKIKIREDVSEDISE